jgi:hypothetical protein
VALRSAHFKPQIKIRKSESGPSGPATGLLARALLSISLHRYRSRGARWPPSLGNSEGGWTARRRRGGVTAWLAVELQVGLSRLITASDRIGHERWGSEVMEAPPRSCAVGGRRCRRRSRQIGSVGGVGRSVA